MARLDTGWHANPKVLSVGLCAMGLHAWSISYCDSTLSDGFVPHGAWPSLRGVRGAVSTLISAGLWEKTDGGYRLHDYLEYNRSRGQVAAERDEMRAAKVLAGRAGGLAKARNAASRRPGRNVAEGLAEGLAESWQTSSRDPSKNVAKASPGPGPLTSPSLTELNPAGPAGWLPAPAHERAREADPKLLADHLALIAKDRASRQASQPIQFSSQETNGA